MVAARPEVSLTVHTVWYSTAASVYDLKRLASFMEDFRTAVELCQSLVMAWEADSKSGRSPLDSSVNMGIVGPVIMCCSK
jgi:hypothetical protein